MSEPNIKQLQEYIVLLLEKNLKMENLLEKIHNANPRLSLKFKIIEVLK